MQLRVVDAGTVSALRSQSLWHGIASAMMPASTPTLSLCRPAEPYVCLGYHRSLDEIDKGACRARGLPVLRRQIGGGPVYIDPDQLFFQITLPVRLAPARVEELYRRWLGPAVAAFRSLGLDARLRGINDIAVGERKLSGTGAGQIGEAVTVVANVIFRFPHERMVEVLALPSPRMREECLRLMRRHVSSLEAEGLGGVGFPEVRAALVKSYAAELGCVPMAGELTGVEQAAVAAWEQTFADKEWVSGPPAPRPGVFRVKICEDVFVVAAAEGGWQVQASLVGGRVESALIEGGGGDGVGVRMGRALAGQTVEAAALRSCLEPFGEAGRRVLGLLEPGLARA